MRLQSDFLISQGLSFNQVRLVLFVFRLIIYYRNLICRPEDRLLVAEYDQQVTISKTLHLVTYTRSIDNEDIMKRKFKRAMHKLQLLGQGTLTDCSDVRSPRKSSMDPHG